ncbi:DUF5683 domain-containing protein [Croceivirga radicis]|uniref:DUF5683 domain-containing protein n=1 Tax=Croceivirga radicis TaxID=1929488 RepID=UPI000255BA37|nr:DUF5683 domain-containing protein [Croceivirga radicis]
MNKSLLYIVLFIALTFSGNAQTEKDSVVVSTPTDSITNAVAEKGIVVEEVFVAQKEINPLAPAKAAFYSAVVPGLGQIYNKKYWKAPIAWGLIGWGVYNYSTNNTNYKRFRTAFKRRKAGFSDDEFIANVSDSGLEDAQERAQENRDIWLLATIGFYALNIIDANVDAHLKQFNVSDQLSYDISPYLEANPLTGEPNYGVALLIKF